mgnify:CR=1 FL=1
MQGYGCCQSVVAAFADLYGLDDTMAKRIGAGFGGGVGRMRMMCGAVSGIVVLVGLDCGQTEGSDREGKSACYKVVQELLAQSKAQNGSLICAEILGLKGNVKAASLVYKIAEQAEAAEAAEKEKRAAKRRAKQEQQEAASDGFLEAIAAAAANAFPAGDDSSMLPEPDDETEEDEDAPTS